MNFKNIIIIILFIVQCWIQASKPEPLKQDTQKGKDNRKEKCYESQFKLVRFKIMLKKLNM